jgi:hypothetical protein
VALLLASFPELSHLTFPFSVSGFVLGACAVAWALACNKDRWLVPAAGAVVSLGVLLVVQYWPGLLGAHLDPALQAEVEDTTPHIIPLKTKARRGVRTKLTVEPRPDWSPEGGDWPNASRAAVRLGDVRIQILLVKVSPVTINKGPEDEQTREEYLLVSLRATNVGAAGEGIPYSGWTKNASGGNGPTLRDRSGALCRRKTFPANVTVLGQAGKERLYPGRGVNDLLVFEVPPEEKDCLFLELPASAWSGSGTVRFALPKEMVHRS